MTIINKRDKSPETSELVARRIELAKPGAMRPHGIKTWAEEFTYPDDWRKTKEERSNRSISNSREKRENHTFAPVISETLATKYHKEQDKTKKHTETPNQSPQTTPKKRWQHMNPEPTPQYRYKNTATAQSRK